MIRPFVRYPDAIGSVRSAFASATLCVVAALSLLATAPPALAARPLTTAIADGVYGEAPSVRDVWIARTVASGARIVLLSADWAAIAPATRPAGFAPTNPADPSYNWQTLDAAVRALNASGLQVLLTVADAPAWAEGPGRPASVVAGAWRPSSAAFGQFATAIAARYSGSFPDPALAGATLPRVRYWQAWSEPNLDTHLAPQWTRHGHRFSLGGPGIYRALLNAFYAGVKSVRADNVVITGGTAPYGDPGAGGHRLMPALFVRELLCLHGAALRSERCPNPAHFDILAHDPYDVGSPSTRALNADDVSAPDFAKLTRPLAVAVHRGLARPRARKRVWVTEFSYDSNPPDPQGVPAARQARWLEEALYIFWRQGIDTVAWFLIADQPPIPDYATTYQSGLYLIDGTPKPALQAFRFPFVVEPAGRGHKIAWGKAPVGGTLAIERLRRGQWSVLARVAVRAGAVFERRLAVRSPASFRAVVGSQASLTWRVG